MAQTIDLKAKQRKQIIILAVGGALLLALMAIQLPKLTGGSAPAAASAESEPAAGATGEPGATGTETPGAVTPAPAGTTEVTGTVSGPTAVVAGVTIPSGAGAAPAEGQLWSFSRFPVKDPFVPQVTEDGVAVTPGSEAQAPPAIDQSFNVPGSGRNAATGSSGASGAATGSGAAAPATPEPPAYATIQVNGKAEQLERKQAFPKAEPIFVLVALTKNSVKVGVKGGAFTNGATVAVERGRPVTLMDTATGARYVLKLVYLGAEPEQIESFSSSAGRPSTTK